MNCKETVALFDSYVNKTINSAEKQALEEHLKTCETCRKQLELYSFYFSDVKIEDDFLVPSQLNAKIKYTIQQAREQKETKKIPFWQNKRIFSAATACAFLLMAGIFGISNYQALQDAAKSPVIETNDPVIQGEIANLNTALEQSETPAMAKESRQVTPVYNNHEETLPETANEAPTPEVSEDVAAYSGEANTNFTADAVAEPFTMTRTVAAPEDISLSVDWKDTILTQFPHEVITEDIFLVTVTKAELEAITGQIVETDETKTQLFIRFTASEQ